MCHIKGNDIIYFETANDHRLAMSMAVLSSYLSLINPNKMYVIDDKKAVDKTFPDFWKYLSLANIKIVGTSIQPEIKYNLKFADKRSVVEKSLILIGNRGSGKTTIGKEIAHQNNCLFIDVDEKIV
jgi:hypothetical protein